MNFYKLAMTKLPEIEAAMEEARAGALSFRGGNTLNWHIDVVLHDDGDVQVFTLTDSSFARAPFEGTGVVVVSYPVVSDPYLLDEASAEEVIERLK